jgi:hypothetical protein
MENACTTRLIPRAERRAEMLAHCLDLLERAGAEYAMWAADRYEALEPWFLDGLGKRVRKEVEKRREASHSPSRGSVELHDVSGR